MALYILVCVLHVKTAAETTSNPSPTGSLCVLNSSDSPTRYCFANATPALANVLSNPIADLVNSDVLNWSMASLKPAWRWRHRRLFSSLHITRSQQLHYCSPYGRVDGAVIHRVYKCGHCALYTSISSRLSCVTSTFSYVIRRRPPAAR